MRDPRVAPIEPSETVAADESEQSFQTAPRPRSATKSATAEPSGRLPLPDNRSRASAAASGIGLSRSRAATTAAPSLRDERDGRHSYDRTSLLRRTPDRQRQSHVTATRRATIADPCWCSSPSLRPTLRKGKGRIAHADQTALPKPSHPAPDHGADAALRPHGVVDLTPAGPPSPETAVPRSPASFLSGLARKFAHVLVQAASLWEACGASSLLSTRSRSWRGELPLERLGDLLVAAAEVE
jgi:hypothetical protein